MGSDRAKHHSFSSLGDWKFGVFQNAAALTFPRSSASELFFES